MTIRIPDPKANTTTEAYLAYKAGYLEESELKPVLYEPYLHFDAWLAYWAGLTETYPTDKTENPEMLCDEEALVAYLSGVTDTYPEDIKDPYDVRIVGYLRHLASVRWPEPDYPVNNEEFYLSTMEPTHTSNPVPSSDIELDTVEGKIISVEAYGDTFQQTYTGKNLIAPTDLHNGAFIGYSQLQDKTYTETDNTRYRTVRIENLPAGTYTVSINWKYTARLLRIGADGSVVAIGQDSNTYIFTTTTDGLFGITFRNTTSTEFSDDDYTIQLEAGSYATSFEPYVGGIPAPNPDYPQDVNVVTGRQVVKMNGKNIFDKDAGGILNTVVDANGLGSNVPNTYRTVFAPCQPNTTYTVSKAFDSTKNRFSIAYTKTIPTYNMSEVYGRTFDNTKSALTITTGADAKYIVAYVWISGGSVSANDMTASVQIEEGDQASSFEPYQSSDYEINLGKNLFSGNYSQFDNTGGAGTLYSYFKLPESGDYTLTIIAKNDIGAQSPQKFIGFTANGGDATGGYVWVFAESTTMQKGDVRSIRNTYQGNRLGCLSMYPNNETTLQWFVENFDIQLEVGDTATSYAPYFEPIELCKIGSYQDYIYKDGDDWYVHKVTKKTIFNGAESENWVLRASKSHTFQVSISISRQGLSNYFTNILAADFDIKPGMYAATSGSLIISYPDMADLTAFTTWLGTHNLVFYEVLLNVPADTKITNDALIAQLEALADADTYDGKTYIKVSATDPNLPARLKVEAYKY